jgi:hypothetical protein
MSQVSNRRFMMTGCVLIEGQTSMMGGHGDTSEGIQWIDTPKSVERVRRPRSIR